MWGWSGKRAFLGYGFKHKKQGGELLGIKVLDHIIIGDKDLYSFKTEGLI